LQQTVHDLIDNYLTENDPMRRNIRPAEQVHMSIIENFSLAVRGPGFFY